MMRGIVDAASRRDGDAMAERCRAFVERSADYAVAVLGRHDALSAAE